jgi:drug/metabolite transporter (DMT)-like permease
LLALIGFIGGSVPFLLFFKGLQMTTGTTSAFLHKTLFIYASIFALIFLREKLSKGFIIGALALLVGNFLLIRPDFALSIGHLFILVATVLWAAENTLAKYTLKDVPGTVVAFGRMFFGAIFLSAFLASMGKLSLVVSMSSAQYLWIGFTALFLFGYVITFYNGLAKIPVSTATAVLALGSPITTLLSWLALGKTIPLHTAAGIGIIATGISAVTWSGHIRPLFRRISHGWS